MKLLPLKTSLLALALFAAATPGIAMAAGKAESGTLVVAQAEDGSAAGTDRIEAIRKFIKGGRNLSKLDDAKLQQRLKRPRNSRIHQIFRTMWPKAWIRKSPR